MAINIEKFEQAFAKMKEVDALLFEAGVYELSIDSSSSFKYAYEDIEMDIVRAKEGTLDEA